VSSSSGTRTGHSGRHDHHCGPVLVSEAGRGTDTQPAGSEPAAPDTWDLDNVELVTVGVDVGSSTSHMVLSRLHLQRLAQSLSSRFVVVARDELFRSPILLTPFTDSGLIDTAALQHFIAECYLAGGITPSAVDTGVVILTGVALERANARAVAELFADGGGQFVCASAGHNLEAILAAHGSGAVALSRRDHQPVLHIDIGGGTTKLAVIVDGEIVETSALSVGGRLLAFDAAGVVVRAEHAALQVAAELGIHVEVGRPLTPEDRERLADHLARALCEAIFAPGSAAATALVLTATLSSPPAPGTRFTCSGGVSEYVFGRQSAGFGDIATDLARHLRQRFTQHGAELVPTGEGIRATALGASQFTVQLTGNTVLVSDDALLPLRNLPVVRARLPRQVTTADVAAALHQAMERLDLADVDSPLCICLPWEGDPHHATLHALASGVVEAYATRLAAGRTLVLALEADVGRAIGAILRDELGVASPLVSLDGLDLQELDYVDVGRPIEPSGVLPVVVKSLAFPLPDTGG